MKRNRRVETLRAAAAALLVVVFSAPTLAGQTRPAGKTQWAPAAAPLMTRWGRQVTPENAWTEYPRPQMARSRWLNLNGLWNYAITDADAAAPKAFDGQILVPYAIESALSGVGKRVGPEDRLWYERRVEIPAAWKGERLLLHFEAVDWDATVWVNGAVAGSHRGGYDRFTVDITELVRAGQEQEIVVAVRDPSSTGDQPRGKQKLTPQGIWYTPTTGIWQTVWIEPVSAAASIGDVRVTPDIDRGVLEVAVLGREPVASDEYAVRVRAFDGGRQVAESVNRIDRVHTLSIPQAKLWSPDHPFLYDLSVELFRVADPIRVPTEGRRRIVRRGEREQGRYAIAPGAEAIDSVGSYFGMRKISVGKAADGYPTLLLNNEPLFQYGPLDQGYWPDGGMTPPSDEAMRFDLEFLKRAGFNMLRKHIKVEPDRYYYYTDRLGLLVWQDMPSGMMMADERFKERSSPQHVMPEDEAEMLRSPESAAQFELELRQMLDELHDFPSIVTWVVMNEGWGQYDTKRLAAMVEAYDPSRLVNAVSGWRDVAAGDFIDQHTYDVDLWDRERDGRRNLLPDPDRKRVAVVGEFGGLGHPVDGHLWQTDRNWGYQTYMSVPELLKQYEARLNQIKEGRKTKAIRAAVYTQTTDVEGEVNGLLTYDREVVKLDPAVLRKLHESLYRPVAK